MKPGTNTIYSFARLTAAIVAFLVAAIALPLAAQEGQGHERTGGAGSRPDGLLFDGSGTTLEVRSTPALDLQDEVTLEAWVRPGRFAEAGVRLIDKSPAGAQSGYMLDTYPGNSLRLLLAEGMLTARDVLSPGEWAHVAGVQRITRHL